MECFFNKKNALIDWNSKTIVAKTFGSFDNLVAGPDRRIFLPDGLLDRSEIPEYLTGEVPGEYVTSTLEPL